MVNSHKQNINNFFNESSMVKLVAYGPFIFIPAVILFLSFLIVNASHTSFEQNVEKIEQNLHNTYKKTIKTEVESMVNHIAYHKSVTKDEMKKRIKKRVNVAIRIATAIKNKYKDSKTKQEIKDIIIEAIRPMLWNGGESFIWILDYDGVFKLAPEYLKHLEGKSIIDFQDATGKEIIKEEIEICKSIGEGFLWDTFTRPNKGIDKQYHQLAFVKNLGFYDWYMGSSEYLDSATKHDDEVLLTSLSKVDAKSENYMYIVKKDGMVLMHSAMLDAVGTNMKVFREGKSKDIFILINELLENKNAGYITYKWYNPKTQAEELKYTYIKLVPSSDWIVAKGYYESTIKDKLAKQSLDLYTAHNMKLTNIFFGSIVILLISLFISYLVSRYIRKSFTRYQEQITAKANELKILNNSLELKVKERTEQLLEATRNLEQIAKTDFLTKAHSRYSIMEILKQEISRHNRHKTAFSLAMIDIDWFKKINDEFGHDKGDYVLRNIVQLFKLNLRDIDYIGRYGGEEFLILMPNTTIDNAKITIERVMKNISEYDFGVGHSVTISVGLVQSKELEAEGELLKRADQLLYKSKENGRNLLSL